MTVWTWRKYGVIWRPSGDLWWCRSHASFPTPHRMPDGTLRIFFSGRDRSNVGRTGFLDVSPENPADIRYLNPDPVLEIGTPGCFDDNGVCGCSIVTEPDGSLRMYYVGFELSHQVRYRLFTGLAVSRDHGQSFQRLSKVPVLDRSSDELLFRCGPFVLNEKGRYRLWYVAGSGWIDVENKKVPTYDLRYAESSDGVTWPEKGRVCLPIENEDEHGFGRPYVLREGDGYRMFYSVRRKSHRAYRLGMAVSTDGLTWQREDERFGLDVSDQGWDSEEICYAAPIWIENKLYIFYNGNGMGETGIGLAVLESTA